jgi:peptidyl-prolyl cis-trans isomerase B (cyclophilin B)
MLYGTVSSAIPLTLFRFFDTITKAPAALYNEIFTERIYFRMKRRIVCLLAAALLLLGLTACANKDSGNNGEAVMVEITMRDGGVIKLELYPDVAPITVENFTKLANEGFYDGLIFHRVIKGFMIQGGDPEGTGFGGSDTNIKGEFAVNGVANNISHVRGVISMARRGEGYTIKDGQVVYDTGYDSGSCQFFIVHKDSLFLDGKYAAFGWVTEGMEVVDAIAKNVPVTDNNGTVKAGYAPVIEYIKVIK